MFRYKVKEIVETDCLLLKDVKSRTQSNEKYYILGNSYFLATKDGKITLGIDRTLKNSNSFLIYSYKLYNSKQINVIGTKKFIYQFILTNSHNTELESGIQRDSNCKDTFE